MSRNAPTLVAAAAGVGFGHAMLPADGDKARAVKARYVGVCQGCGAYTQPRNGKGGAYAYCRVAMRMP